VPRPPVAINHEAIAAPEAASLNPRYTFDTFDTFVTFVASYGDT
jgi:hypothetical protein